MLLLAPEIVVIMLTNSKVSKPNQTYSEQLAFWSICSITAAGSRRSSWWSHCVVGGDGTRGQSHLLLASEAHLELLHIPRKMILLLKMGIRHDCTACQAKVFPLHLHELHSCTLRRPIHSLVGESENSVSWQIRICAACVNAIIRHYELVQQPAATDCCRFWWLGPASKQGARDHQTQSACDVTFYLLLICSFQSLISWLSHMCH